MSNLRNLCSACGKEWRDVYFDEAGRCPNCHAKRAMPKEDGQGLTAAWMAGYENGKVTGRANERAAIVAHIRRVGEWLVGMVLGPRNLLNLADEIEKGNHDMAAGPREK